MSTSTSYAWDAMDYSQQSVNQQKWARELIDKLNLKGNEDILDIGCGDGKVTVEIASKVPGGSVLGIDNSLDMIELAMRVFPVENHPNLSFRQLDARSFSIQKQFDIVFSNAVLHWVIDHKPVLENIYRCLKPGGRLLLQMGGKGNAAGILSIIDEILNINHWQPYYKNFEFPYGFHGAEEYKIWLTDQNLIPRRVELIPKDMIHPDQKGLEGWIRTTWLPYTLQIPESQREDFIHEIANRYVMKRKPDNNGYIHVDMIRLEVEAEKPLE